MKRTTFDKLPMGAIYFRRNAWWQKRRVGCWLTHKVVPGATLKRFLPNGDVVDVRTHPINAKCIVWVEEKSSRAM